MKVYNSFSAVSTKMLRGGFTVLQSFLMISIKRYYHLEQQGPKVGLLKNLPPKTTGKPPLDHWVNWLPFRPGVDGITRLQCWSADGTRRKHDMNREAASFQIMGSAWFWKRWVMMSSFVRNMHPQLAPWHFGNEVWQMRLWMKELNIRSFKKDNQARYSTADPKMPSSFCFLPSGIWLYLPWIMEMKIVFRCFSPFWFPPIFEVNSYQIYQILFMDPYPKLEVESAKYASQKPRTFSGLSCSHGLSTWQVPKLHSWKFEDHGECCLNFFQNVWYQGVLYHFQIETGRFQEVKLYDRITFQVSDFLSSKASTTNRLPFGSPLEGCKTSVKFQIFPGNGVWNSGLLANPKLFHSEQFTKKKWWKRGFWWNDGIFWGLIFSHFHCKPRNSRKQTMPGVLMFWEMLLFSTWLWHGLTCSTDSTGIFQTHGQFFWAGILSLRL